ncbi:MAG: hypothetical protein NE330_05715 [Lentisphaeraceae bacterium]|nr:hypothetical protein [Lentisphaeraceae bacterium]
MLKSLILLLLMANSLFAEQTLKPLKGFDPDTYKNKWTIGHGVWEVEKGVLSGQELEESNHSAGTGVNHPCSDGSITFDFNLSKAEFVQLVLDEVKGKKDHRFKLRIYNNGDMKINAGSKRNKTLKAMGPVVKVANFDNSAWHKLKVTFNGQKIEAFVDGKLIIDVSAPKDFAQPKNRMSLNVKGFAQFKNFRYLPSH